MNRAERAALLDAILARGPGYLPPSWQPSPGGASHGVLTALAHDAALLEDALRAAPDKLAFAFLDAMGVSLLAPRPARVPLVFTLAADAPVDLPLPPDTEVAADVPPALPGSLATTGPAPPAAAPEPIVFATDQAISLTRARLRSVLSVVPARDAWRDHAAEAEAGPVLFEDLRPVPHHLYLGHDTLFQIAGPAEISLMMAVGGARTAGTFPVTLAWEYHTGDGWLPFEPVIDQTQGLRTDGEILLRKTCGPGLAATEVDGVETFWIRARVVEPLPEPGTPGTAAEPARLDTVRARVRLRTDGLPPDAAIADGLPVDPSTEFRPFGLQPALGATFLLACDQAFARAGARIGVEILPSDANSAAADPSDRALVWEYTGPGGAWQTVISGRDEQLEAGKTPRTIWFQRPDDWQPAEAAGQKHHWLRIRLAKGDYGGPTTFKVQDDTVVASNQPEPPVLARLTVSYAYETQPHVLDHVRARNGFAYKDVTGPLRWGREGVRPFRSLEDRSPAVYLGFDRALPTGLVSLLAAGRAEAGTAPQSGSPFAWEYRSPTGWSELAVLDETAGFRATGMLQFIGPEDHVATPGPDAPLHWVRARLKQATATPDALPLATLRLNALWATNRRAVRRELLGHGDGSAHLTLPTQHAPVLPGQRIEVQEWRGQGREWESLFADVPGAALPAEPDGRGGGVVWVAWEVRAHLHGSGPADRHYTVEPTTGLVRFGDGVQGMRPPPGAPIVASYHYGGGPAGNVAPGRISQLHSAVPYVESVANPIAASGGAASEPGGRVRSRGAQLIRHRDRALSPGDYEWLARDTSPEVAVTRCLPATGPDGGQSPGWVTVVVAPWSDEPEPQPSPELLRRVREHLARRAPAAVAARVRVVGPTYRRISVLAGLTVSDPGRAAAVEEAVRRALDALLHPLTGGPTGGGWRFGAAVHLSQVASVLRVTPGVAYASEIGLAADGVVEGDRIDVEDDRLPAAGRHLLRLAVEA